MTKTLKTLQPLIGYLQETAHLQSAISLLSWDQETYMPKGSGAARAEQMATLEGMAHQRGVGPRMRRLLSRWIHLETGHLLETDWDEPASALLRELWRDFNKAVKLPAPFVKKQARAESLSQQVWVVAREKNDFKMFMPHLKEMVSLKRAEAEYLGYQETPYNALLDHYEPGMTVAKLDGVFPPLGQRLLLLLHKIMGSPVRPRADFLHREYPADGQIAFGHAVLDAMGYRFDQGRQDCSAHPFTTSFHPTDVRITTRVNEQDLLSSLFSSIHEGGHALYDQGLSLDYYGTPLSEAISLGIHESQSRLWENGIGRSGAFWRYFFPRLQKHFKGKLEDVNLEAFYAAVNRVQPSLIRVEADELTYQFHIMVRYEIERALIEGQLQVADLPSVWGEKMKSTLGITPDSDVTGVLQDVHWSCGSFGYFPTYTLGNLYAAQFLKKAEQEIPSLISAIEQGNLLPLKSWLNEKIHRWGRRFTSTELLIRVTGEPLNPDYFVEYLDKKYTEIYNL